MKVLQLRAQIQWHHARKLLTPRVVYALTALLFWDEETGKRIRPYLHQAL